MRKHIVIFGNLKKSQEYSRSFVLCKSFEDLGCRLTYCTASSRLIRSGISPMSKIIETMLIAPLRWVHLILKYLFLPDYDLIYVPYPSHIDGWMASILAKKKQRPLVIDSFLGLYDTIVRDRKMFTSNSIPAKLIWHYENQLLKSADFVLMDTLEHSRMIENDYNLPEQRLKVIPVGIDESLWVASEFPSDKTFKVIFWSTFIPLHGCEVVVHAAKLLEMQCPEIRFLVIGKGQEDKKFKQTIENLKPDNLEWIENFISLREVQKYVQQSHCCLGIFGTQEKTKRVIPYKAYQALASCRPLITARTRASDYLFDDGINAILVNPGDPLDLSMAIQRLASDRILSMSIGKNGRILYEDQLSNIVIKDQLERVLESVFK